MGSWPAAFVPASPTLGARPLPAHSRSSDIIPTTSSASSAQGRCQKSRWYTHVLTGKMSRSKLGAVCGDVERSGRIAGVDQARSSDKFIEQVVVTDINHLLKEIGIPLSAF